jgi:hypothetical protein
MIVLYFSNVSLDIFLIWIIGCPVITILECRINDIVLDNYIHVEFINVIHKKRLVLTKLKVWNISVGMGPAFLLDTNEGNFIINYTRSNYNAIVKILERIRYKETEIFLRKVKCCFFH